MSAGAEDLTKRGVNLPSGKCLRCLLRCRLYLRGREGLLSDSGRCPEVGWPAAGLVFAVGSLERLRTAMPRALGTSFSPAYSRCLINMFQKWMTFSGIDLRSNKENGFKFIWKFWKTSALGNWIQWAEEYVQPVFSARGIWHFSRCECKLAFI